MQVSKLVVFGLGGSIQASLETLDIPKDMEERVAFIREARELPLACETNRDFLDMLLLLLMETGPEICITNDRRPEGSLYSFFSGDLIRGSKLHYNIRK